MTNHHWIVSEDPITPHLRSLLAAMEDPIDRNWLPSASTLPLKINDLLLKGD